MHTRLVLKLTTINSKMDNIESIRRRLDLILQQKKQVESKLNDRKERFHALEEEYKNNQDSLKVLVEIGKAFRIMSMGKIEELVESSLRGVFEREYGFKVKMEEKRGQVETSFNVKDNGVELDPAFCTGGGLVDVIAMSLRSVLWRLKKQKTAPVMILDEPFRMLSEGFLPNAAALIKELSRKLGVQFIIVTHEPSFAHAADKTFHFKLSQDGKKTIVSGGE